MTYNPASQLTQMVPQTYLTKTRQYNVLNQLTNITVNYRRIRR